MMKLLTTTILFSVMMLGSSWAVASDDAAISINKQAQIYQLEQLHGAFHRAASVRDAVDGDSQAVIDQRIRQVLSLWTEDGVLYLDTGSPLDGYYRGRGVQGDPVSCPMPASKPSNQGTLCTFYTYVAGSFQVANKFISLTSAFKQHFAVQGNTARFYFECHYFDVDSSTGTPPWTAVSHVALTGVAKKINGQWKFWHASAPTVGVPTSGSY
jgi:hypothetical protein